MQTKSHSLRGFLGAKNYIESRQFYNDLGFEEHVIDPKMSLFEVNSKLSFYLQDYYVKEWVNNTMIFLEVEDVEKAELELKSKDLEKTYKQVKFTEIMVNDWGREFMMHDPSGILWHFGEFTQQMTKRM